MRKNILGYTPKKKIARCNNRRAKKLGKMAELKLPFLTPLNVWIISILTAKNVIIRHFTKSLIGLDFEFLHPIYFSP